MDNPLSSIDPFGLMDECSDAIPRAKSKEFDPVQERDADGNEIYYRTMQRKHFDRMEAEGVIATGETGLSPSALYAQTYDGVTVRIAVKPGTAAKFQKIAHVADDKVTYPHWPGVPTVRGIYKWNLRKTVLKLEGAEYPHINDGKGVMNTLVGKGAGLKILNENIVSYTEVSYQPPRPKNKKKRR
ncbi:hypothetical protein [Massilia violaceinigra]|uniref:hypothetical protein n=1 Tax=Massilia violaceinigra TaxID=2045208 RepID=UPI001FB279DC|nr:hypothetical protein [Massilia violaceinigra]